MTLIRPSLFLLSVSLGAIAAAQSKPAAQLSPDAAGCQDSRTLPKLPGCRVDNCEKKDSDRREVTMKDDGKGESTVKAIEGDTRAVMYECAEGVTSRGIMEQAASSLRAAGFEVPYFFSEDEGTMTAFKGETWLTLESAARYYTLIETKLTAPDFESINDAASMADAIEKYGRVPLYGIHFLSGRADLAPESVTALRELAIMLDDNPDWTIRIEGHTDNIGSKQENSLLSLHRAVAVGTYLTGRGIKKTRYTTMGMADAHPLVPNDTDANRAKNRRIEIVKVQPGQ